MSSIRYEEIFQEKVEDGTSNPWATSSTSRSVLIVWSELEEDELRRNIMANKFKTSRDFPGGYTIQSIKQSAIPKEMLSASISHLYEYRIEFSLTVYYN